MYRAISERVVKDVRIAVCGTSTSTPEEDALAEEVGRLCAERGATVICGGLAGVMSAVARGAASAGGTSIGLLPGDDESAANPYLTYALPTGMGEMRNGLIAKVSQGMITIGGGYGTLSEIGFMLRLGRPVASVASWNIQQPGSTEPEAAIYWAADPQDAVDWLSEAVDL